MLLGLWDIVRMQGLRANKGHDSRDTSGISLSARRSRKGMGLVGSGCARQRLRFAQMRAHWKPQCKEHSVNRLPSSLWVLFSGCLLCLAGFSPLSWLSDQAGLEITRACSELAPASSMGNSQSLTSQLCSSHGNPLSISQAIARAVAWSMKLAES